MRRHQPAVVGGVLAGRDQAWIRVPMAFPTVWMATPDGLVCLDLIAVELAANGIRKGWTLTSEEARYAASVMFAHGLPYSTVAQRIGASGATMQSWFPEQAVPSDPRMARTRSTAKPKRTPKPRPAIKCGTYPGYRRHIRRKEPTCAECRDAKNAADRHYTEHGTYIGASGATT